MHLCKQDIGQQCNNVCYRLKKQKSSLSIKQKFNIQRPESYFKNLFVALFIFSAITISVDVPEIQMEIIHPTEAFDPTIINDNIVDLQDDHDTLIDTALDSSNKKQGEESSKKIILQSSETKILDGDESNPIRNNHDDTITNPDTNLNLISNSVPGQGSPSLSAASSNQVHGDFDDDGFDDLAIGVPNEDLGALSEVGAVQVIYGHRIGLDPKLGDQFLTQGSLVGSGFDGNGDNFGKALAKGDFNADGFDDLAIGVPQDLIGSIRPGAVYVVYGTVLGLSGDEFPKTSLQIILPGNGIDEAEDDDRFGQSLTAGDFNGDGKDDLAIGIPGEDIGSSVFAGAVQVIYGSGSGLSSAAAVPIQFWTQNGPGIDDSVEGGEFFGSSLTAGDFNSDGKDDLAVGSPSETGTFDEPQGAVNVIYGSSSGLSSTIGRNDQFWTQDTPNVNDVAEFADDFGRSLASGDFNGDGSDDLAIGAPGEDFALSISEQAGGVNVIYGSPGGLSATTIPDQFWTQDNSDINDVAENGDGFGFSLISGDFNGDGKDDLAIGAQAESLFSSNDAAGAVNVIYGASTGLSATAVPDQFWSQNSQDIDDQAETLDFFGTSLSSGDFNSDGKHDLAIGIPNEDIDPGAIGDAGAVEVIYGSSSGLSATNPRSDQFWHQDRASVKDSSESGDKFGSALG
jgi:hypothetical protein